MTFRVAVSGCLVSLLSASSLSAQNDPAGAFRVGELILPFEVSQGLVTDRGHPLPYTASGRLYPMLVLDSHGRWRAGGSLAATYRNPDWEIMIGPRLSVHAVQIRPLDIEGLGIEVAIEGLFGTNGGDEIGLETVIDLDGLFRLGVRGARDYSRGQYLVEGVIGLDPLSWFGAPPEDP